MPTKNLDALGGMMAALMVLAMLASLGQISFGPSSSGGSSSVVPINANGEMFKFFLASDPPQRLTQLDWGTLAPGENVTKNIYITCIDKSKTYELTITTSRWGPDQAPEYMMFSENGTGQLMTTQSGIIGFRLEVYPNCTGVTWFSFNIIVNFEEVT